VVAAGNPGLGRGPQQGRERESCRQLHQKTLRSVPPPHSRTLAA
jgi:hypothetical protein